MNIEIDAGTNIRLDDPDYTRRVCEDIFTYVSELNIYESEGSSVEFDSEGDISQICLGLKAKIDDVPFPSMTGRQLNTLRQNLQKLGYIMSEDIEGMYIWRDEMRAVLTDGSSVLLRTLIPTMRDKYGQGVSFQHNTMHWSFNNNTFCKSVTVYSDRYHICAWGKFNLLDLSFGIVTSLLPIRTNPHYKSELGSVISLEYDGLDISVCYQRLSPFTAILLSVSFNIKRK